MGIKTDSDGNLIASPVRLQKLAEMGLLDTPPLVASVTTDGIYHVYRDFDTLEQAQSWESYYEFLASFIDQTTSEVEQKEVGVYIGAYQYLTDEEKITVWNNTD
jgi:hypothetical protein